MFSLAWVFQLDALFCADSFGSSSLSLETAVGFPVHDALETIFDGVLKSTSIV